eukprot:scaffold1065_cov406-Prasinococcus_capsulatus_cf.AAC.5
MSSIVISAEVGGGLAHLVLSTGRHLDQPLAYGSFSASNAIAVTVDEKKSASELAVDTPGLSIKLGVVPPVASWKIEAEDAPSFSHINLQVTRVDIAHGALLGGILGVSARGEHPTDGEAEAAFEACNYVTQDVLAIVP